MGTEEFAFLAEIHANPHDETARLIYADWLEEQGDSRGEYVRLECQLVGLQPGDVLYQELRPRLDELRDRLAASWLAEIGHTRVVNCVSRPATSTLRCRKRWEAMNKTTKPLIRKCGDCERAVFFCRALEDAGKRNRREI